jgi:hypothetical protein
MKTTLILISLLCLSLSLQATVITAWDFEAQSTAPSTGEGMISLIGGVTNDGYNTGYNSTYGWSTTNYPLQSTNNRTAGVYFELSSVGYEGITLSWAIRHSNTSANRSVLFYTLDRTASEPVWVEAAIVNASNGDLWFPGSFNGTSVTGLNNNPNLAFKLVSSFADAGNTMYMPSKTTSTYAAGGKWRIDSITIEGTAMLPHLEISSSLTPFYAIVGSSSAIQTYSVYGSNLNSNLIIDTPQYFQVCISGTDNYSNHLSLTPRNGIVDKSIDIKFTPLVTGEFSSTIVHYGGGIDSTEVDIFGSTTKPEPTAYPTNLNAQNITYYQLDLHWTDSLGAILPDGYLIRGSKVSPDSIAYPVDGIAEADKKLTKNVSYGTQEQLIFELNETHPYWFKIFPYTNSGTAINYKTDGIVPSLYIMTTTGPIGSDLSAGDIAFVEYASDSPDRFSFVLLKDVAENTKISFTDKAWTGTAFADGEGAYYWRGIARAYQQGEVIHIEEGILRDNEGIYNPDFEGFSNSGDQILAFQGDLSDPVFLAGFSTMGWLTSGTVSNNTSYLPESLTLSTNALGFSTEVDNGYYNGSMSGTVTELLSAINNPVNWLRNNSLANITFPNWQFNLVNTLNAPDVCISCSSPSTLHLEWTAVPNASVYHIYCSTNPYVDFPDFWTEVIDNYADTSIDIDLTTEASQTMFYRVLSKR